MADLFDCDDWTATTICNALHHRHQQKRKSQIQLNMMTHDEDLRVYVIGDYVYTQKPSIISSPKLIGEAILKLSQFDEYDRIIKVNVIDSQESTVLNWMIPLLSDNFKSLIELTPDYGGEFGALDYPETYNILCDMITMDKLIKVPLHFCNNNSDNGLPPAYNFKQNRFFVDTSKLMNAIKSTNALKSIIVICVPSSLSVEVEQQSFYYATESILKEALSLNFSVTDLSIIDGTYVRECKEMDIFCSWNEDGYEETDFDKDLKGKYKKWWPIIKKRNEKSQIFNKILAGTHKDDGIWNNNKCPNKIAKMILQKNFPEIPLLSYNPKGDRCFCLKCSKLRNDAVTYKRGNPPKSYTLPLEWVRFGLKTNDLKCVMNDVWKDWHVAFHGTTKEVIPQIFKAGLQLLKPGDYTINGYKLGIRSGHIKKSFERYNKHSKKKEIFDPNQIYLSPSIRYSGHGAYAKWFYCSHPEDKNTTIKVQFAFQARIRPGSYGVGQETVGAEQDGEILDKHYNNSSLEWYTQEHVGIVLTGLLLHIKEVENDNIDTDEKTASD